MIARHEVDRVPGQLQSLRGRLADGCDTRRFGDAHAVPHEHVDGCRARDDKPLDLTALQGGELVGEAIRVVAAREIDERGDHRGGTERAQLRGNAVAPFAAAGHEHAPSEQWLDHRQRAGGRTLDGHLRQKRHHSMMTLSARES